MNIYCKCYCSLFGGKSYTKYVIEQNEKIVDYGSQIYRVNNKYEGYVKILNYLSLRIEKLLNGNITYSSVVIMFDNEELIKDLSAEVAVTIDKGSDNDFSELFSFIKSKNIILKQLSNEGNYISEYKNESLELFKYKEEELYNNVKMLLCIVDNIVKKDEKYYSNRISQLDLMVQDILHFVENKELDSVKKIEYIDSLKKIRQIRRNTKNNREIAEQFRTILFRLKYVLTTELEKKNDNVNISKYEFQEFKKKFSSKEARKSLLNYL